MQRDGRPTAISLMRMALALLDRDGARLAAAHLQYAIDVAEGPSDTDGSREAALGASAD